MVRKIVIGGIVIVFVFFVGWYIYSSQLPGEYDSFAKCLTSKGFSMGGTNWCSSCKEQKRMFGRSFRYVDYHNCDYERNWCVENGIYRYPTWVLPDGGKLMGIQELRELSFISGCELAKD
jgi:hypothetical protein